MSSKKSITKKDYEKMQNKLEKMKFTLSEIRKKDPKLVTVVTSKLDVKTDLQIKLTGLNSIIGYLVRKGVGSNLQMETLIDIANDYEKRLNES
jgi:hypothetical protein